MSRKKWTPPQIAERWCSGVGKVHGFIQSGELVAIDLATKRGGSPRYKIDIDDLEAFEQSRRVVPPAPKPRRRRRDPSFKQFV